MDQVQKFATDQNVTRFVSALQTEADPARRKSLQAMLLEEENRFGVCLEQLDKAERHIGECRSHIGRLESLIGKLRVDGHDIGPSERLLRNMTELYDIFVSYRAVIRDALDRSVL